MNDYFNLILVIYIVAAFFSLIFSKKHQLTNLIANILSATASLSLLILTALHLIVSTSSVELLRITTSVPNISLVLKIDNLSAFFLLCLAILSMSVSIFSIGYMKHYFYRINIGLFNCLYNIFILSMILVITSSNLISFLVCWEIMSLISYALVVYEHDQPENSKAGLIYIIMTHLGTAFLIIAFMLIYVNTGSMEIASAGQLLSPYLKNILFFLFLIGFGVKAGIIPLHVWLPYAHPAALSNISALMSGIMIKTAIYGLIRFILVVLGASTVWWGVVILVLGAISAVLGIAYALIENNYKRLLAYSSIENIGIILIGLGLSFIAFANQQMTIASISLLASLFHLFNHTLFKGALFLGAGAIHYATHTKNLEDLGGLMKRMPYTGLLLLFASLAISALPPFNGFLSEWLTFQSLFQILTASNHGLKILALLIVAALAMAGAMAAACFIKFIGIAFLGLPRSESAQNCREVPIPMLAGIGLLALPCLLFGLFPQIILRLIDRITQEYFAVSISSGLKGISLITNNPLIINESGISLLSATIIGIIFFIVFYTIIRFIGRNTKERIFETWDCGFGGLNSRMQYTATGFSKPLRIVFRFLYRPKRLLWYNKEGPSPYYHSDLNYVVTTEPVFEKYFYHPLAHSLKRWARKSRFYIQTGSVHIYLLYIFLALIALLIYNWVCLTIC